MIFKKIVFIAVLFFPCVQAEQLEGLQSTETEQWLKWEDQQSWSGIDHFLDAWKGNGPEDPQSLQEKIFQARFSVMNATAHPESTQYIPLLRKNFFSLCDAFHANTRSDCLSQLLEHKEALCKDTVVADHQSKVCTRMLSRALHNSDAGESPPQSKGHSKKVKRFRLPGVSSK